MRNPTRERIREMTTKSLTAEQISDEMMSVESLIREKLAAANRIPEAWLNVLTASLAEAEECGDPIESGERLVLGGAQTHWIWIDPTTFPMEYIDEYSALIDDEGHQGYYCYTGELEDTE